MTTQASVIINFHDDPNHCNSETESCNYLFEGNCMIRIVNQGSKTLDRFLSLSQTSEGFYWKTPSCKFIWEKQQNKRPPGAPRWTDSLPELNPKSENKNEK